MRDAVAYLLLCNVSPCFKAGWSCYFPASLQTSPRSAVLCMTMTKAIPLWRMRFPSFLESNSACHPLYFFAWSLWSYLTIITFCIIFSSSYIQLSLYHICFDKIECYCLHFLSFFFIFQLPLLVWKSLLSK